MAADPIRVCVIDDEPIACRRIQRLLKEDSDMQVIEVCHDGEHAATAIRELRPDLVFLDVQMPEMDGFEALEASNAERLPYIIFVTAYDQYAIRAFEFHALDYLLKPFDKKRFAEALQRAKSEIHKERRESSSDNLISLLKEIKTRPRGTDRILIKSGGKVFFVKTEEIEWIEANGKYATIHAKHSSYEIREGMSKLEAQMDPEKFLRIHKSAIVNIDCIEHLQSLLHGDYRLLLRNGVTLTVSRRYRQRLDEIYGKPL